MIMILFALLLSLTSAHVQGAAKNFTGYILSTELYCEGKGECVKWSLRVTRVDTLFRLKNLTLPLITLLPSQPSSDWDFSTFSALDETNRIFYVVASPEGATAANSTFELWGVTVNPDVSAATLTSNFNVTFPEKSGDLVGLHSSNGDKHVTVVFKNGIVAFINPTTGILTQVGDLLGNTTRSSVLVTEVESVTQNDLFAVITDEYHTTLAFATLDLTTFVVNVKALKTKLDEHDFKHEIMREMVWNPDTKLLTLFLSAAGPDDGFDQIFTLDPATGEAKQLSPSTFNLLSSYLLGFNCRDKFDCDGLNNAAWDNVGKKMYFQASLYDAADEDDLQSTFTVSFIGGTDTRNPYINQAISPFEYGFENFQFIQCSGDC
jgi:hypothetical protein